MNDIEDIKKLIESGNDAVFLETYTRYYLKAIATTQLAILKELRKLKVVAVKEKRKKVK